MQRKIKQIGSSIVFIFVNYVVAYIPLWSVRKCFYKCLGMKIGRGSRIYMKCTVYKPWNITIGNNTTINEKCVLDGRGGLVIGDNSSVSIQSMIISASHKSKSKSFEYYESGVIIGNNVWLGARAIVLDGSVLNDASIISAGSVFKGVAEKDTIYAGIPAVVYKKRCLEEPYELCHSDFFR